MERVACLTCYSIYFRGEAYLADRQGPQTVAEFQKILAHPQLTLTDPVGTTAVLGLARAYEFSGDHAKSAAAGKNFQSLWKNSDAGLLPLLPAKAKHKNLLKFAVSQENCCLRTSSNIGRPLPIGAI